MKPLKTRSVNVLPMKRNPFLRIALPVIALAVAAPVLMILSIPTPDNAFGMARLHATARSAQPLIIALERYRHDHGCYPATTTLLYPAYLHTPTHDEEWNGWGYSVDQTTPSPQEYRLFLLLGGDPVLRYEHSSSVARWDYDPGNGAPKTDLPF